MTRLEVLHVDNHLLVVAKPAGLPTVPDDSGDESLLDRARRWVEVSYDKPGRAFLGVVHRLDRPVSGVVCFARTSKAADRLTRALRERRVVKRYLGVCRQAPRPAAGELVQWLRKDRARNLVRAFDEPRPESREARTRWRTLERAPDRVLVELLPETGRPHQLRVALATLGAPLLGDLRYGPGPALPDRSVALHAQRLELPHPTRDELVRVEAPLPALAIWRFGRTTGPAGERPGRARGRDVGREES